MGIELGLVTFLLNGKGFYMVVAKVKLVYYVELIMRFSPNSGRYYLFGLEPVT